MQENRCDQAPELALFDELVDLGAEVDGQVVTEKRFGKILEQIDQYGDPDDVMSKVQFAGEFEHQISIWRCLARWCSEVMIASMVAMADFNFPCGFTTI